jgi:hypothetical protein
MIEWKPIEPMHGEIIYWVVVGFREQSNVVTGVLLAMMMLSRDCIGLLMQL